MDGKQKQEKELDRVVENKDGLGNAAVIMAGMERNFAQIFGDDGDDALRDVKTQSNHAIRSVGYPVEK